MKIEEQELKQLQDIQEKLNGIVNNLGEISYNIIILKSRKSKIKKELSDIVEEEKTLKEFLIQKYGDNLNINIETGEY